MVNARHPDCTCSKGRLCAHCLGIAERPRTKRVNDAIVLLVLCAVLGGALLLAIFQPGMNL